MKNTFNTLILLGRPGSGKSEIIDYIQHTAPEARARRFHLGEVDVLDDFPMLWAWFEEDHILSKVLGKPRLHTTEDGYFQYEYLWHLLIERLSLEYQKRLREADYHATYTTLIEFSRGKQHGGYRAAFPHLSDEVLQHAVILYVHVSLAESLRKNRRRFNPERPDSILEHALPDEKLKRLYGEDDFLELAAADPHYLSIRGQRVPYVIFENEDDVTTPRGEALGARLDETLQKAWELWQKKSSSH